MKNALCMALGAALLCGSAFAANITFDNRFAGDGKGGIEGWNFNKAEEFKPFGLVTSVMKDGLAGVRLASQGKYTAIYLNTLIPAAQGDTFKLTAKVTGKGTFGMGIYMYGSQELWQWRGDSVQKGVATELPTEVSFTIPVKAEDVKNIVPALIADSGADISFYDLKIEKVEPLAK